MGKIGPHDIEVFEEESKPQWLARVHALERVADKVPVDNPWPCHAPAGRPESLGILQSHVIFPSRAKKKSD